MAKQFSQSAVEKSWYAWWEKSGFFAADSSSSKPPFVIVLPPPNVTGALNIGPCSYLCHPGYYYSLA
ncbi:unnamed protein product [Camellia sinensis]